MRRGADEMKVTMVKTAEGKWDIYADKQLAGKCIKSALGDKRYIAQMDNGIEIFAFNQPAVKRLAEKAINLKGMG